MGDPVGTAARLQDELTATLDRLPLPAVRRKELAALRDAARDIAEQLAFIDANYVVLAVDDGVDPVAQARAIFESLLSGTINDGSGLVELLAVSPLLRTLAGAGISVTSLGKMSELENRFSQMLGDDFGVIGDVWKQLRSDHAHKTASIVEVKKKQMPKVRMLASILVKLGLFELATVEVSQRSHGAAHWVIEEAADRNRYKDTHPYRVTFTRLDETQHIHLFTGEWLNDYATLLVSAHLDALAVPHEIYTSVAYTHPAEILRDNSDFDVIVQASGTTAIIECKSGKLTGKAVTKVIKHAHGLATTLKSTGVSTDVRHFLLYIDFGGTRPVVEQGTDGSTVQALTPDQLRRTINALFTEHVGGKRSAPRARKPNSTPATEATPLPEGSAKR